MQIYNDDKVRIGTLTGFKERTITTTYKMSSKNVQKIWFNNVQLFFRFHMILQTIRLS